MASETSEVLELLLATLEAVAVVVANDIGEHRFLDIALERNEVIEPFVAFGMLGRLPAGQHDGILVGDTYRVDHLVLGIARVYVAALEGNAGYGGVEVLILQLANLATVHRVGPFGTESLHVELVSPLANLLVGVEGHPYLAVLDFGVGQQVLHGRYNLGHTGLVVGTEQCLAIGHNQVLPYVVQQFGKLRRLQHHILLGTQHNIGTAVVLDNAGRHVAARHIGARIEVGDKADYRHLLVGVGWQRGHQIAVIVEGHLGKAYLLQLFGQSLGKDHLPRRTGSHIGKLVRLGIETYIVEKTIY